MGNLPRWHFQLPSHFLSEKIRLLSRMLLSLAHPENPSMTAVLSPAAVAAKRKWSARKPTCAAIPVCSIFEFEPCAVW